MKYEKREEGRNKVQMGFKVKAKDNHRGFLSWFAMGRKSALGLYTGTILIGVFLQGFTVYTKFIMPEWALQAYFVVLASVLGDKAIKAVTEIKKTGESK